MVSVIIPNYNHAKYLDERIQSVLNQTYQDFEVIILDDCSTDNSLEIINKYKNNPHISHIIVNEKNCGSPFKQWYKGFELAKGDLIWIAESDDTCEPLFLEKLATAMSKRKDCVVAFCNMLSLNENGDKAQITPSELKDGFYDSSTFISEFMSQGTTIVNASGAIFKKGIAMKVDMQYMNFKGAGDRMFWTEMAEKGSIAYVNMSLNYFRQHSSNSTLWNYQQGINQHEDKLILDYIFKKGYIKKAKYDYIRKKYIFQRILTIKNTIVKKRIFKEWEPSFVKRCYLYLQDHYPEFFLRLRYLFNKIK